MNEWTERIQSGPRKLADQTIISSERFGPSTPPLPPSSLHRARSECSGRRAVIPVWAWITNHGLRSLQISWENPSWLLHWRSHCTHQEWRWQGRKVRGYYIQIKQNDNLKERRKWDSWWEIMFLIHSLNMNTSADLKCKFREWQIKSLHLSGRKKILFPVSKLHEGNVTSIKRKLSLNIYF